MSDTQNSNQPMPAHQMKQNIQEPSLEQQPSELVVLLQTTLDIEQLIHLFSTHIQHQVRHQEIQFTARESGFRVKLGKSALHSCSYNMLIGNQDLGQMKISRDYPFSPADQHRMEYALSQLLYPLKNTLMYQEALKTAHTDPLTGIGNRIAFDVLLEREINLAQRNNNSLTLAVMDIDHFKQVNDQFGHLFGDCVLRDVAAAANRCMRKSDAMFRYGGEEFVFLLSNTEKNGAFFLAERIRKSVERQQFDYLNEQVQVTVSLGLTELQKSDTAQAFFQRADKALYQAKTSGRNCIVTDCNMH